ncbi:MAG: MoxR family ATPase [Planctomycetaceae bacterium]|nr:MoxR family ATPase [Planctomycetaceae bacterium]
MDRPNVSTEEDVLARFSIEDIAPKLAQLKQNLTTVIQGKSDPIDALIVALLASGSVLMEDVPGVGKTTLAKALARSLDVEFRRIQFTPDLLPTDILGSTIYTPADGTFKFHPGPIFCSVLLADEINRASPRTQSALLEAMSERQVTIEGKRMTLPNPFLVLATQNPIDFHGTYPLPEAQLDRFLVHLNIGYPDPDTEADILYAQANDRPIDQVKPVLSIDEVVAAQTMVKQVHVDRSIVDYIVQIVQETRNHHQLRLGVSPRGSLMFFRAVQAAALFAERDHVQPDDVQRYAPYVLPHRCMLTSQARYGSSSKVEIIAEIVRKTRVPV